MPYIETKTNVTITKNQEVELKKLFAEAIEIIPGKSEQWLMLDFIDNERVWFSGEDSPAAIINVEIFGSASASSYNKLTAELTENVSSVLGISPTRIYIKYDEINNWGWNGSNF